MRIKSNALVQDRGMQSGRLSGIVVETSGNRINPPVRVLATSSCFSIVHMRRTARITHCCLIRKYSRCAVVIQQPGQMDSFSPFDRSIASQQFLSHPSPPSLASLPPPSVPTTSSTATPTEAAPNSANVEEIPSVPQSLVVSAQGNGGSPSNGGATPISMSTSHSLLLRSVTYPYSNLTPSSILPGTPGSAGPLGCDTIGLQPSLQNIVSTVNLGCRLDLKRIALHARNAEYNPKRFAAVIMRIRQPRTTALIFSSGKMVCTGAKSEDESRLAARKYARIIQKLGFEAKFLDFKIQNMVGSVDVKFPIRLEGLVLQHQNFCSYEPELFPGLIYRMIQPKIVLLIFVSGKVVLTGAKIRQQIYEAFENIYPILRSFRKQQ